MMYELLPLPHGPLPDVTLTINGVAMRLRHGFKISETANGRNRLDGVIYSPDGTGNRPPVGADVQLVENGVVIFGGLVDTPTEGGVGGAPVSRLLTAFSALDYSGLAERRVLNLTFPPGTLKSWLQTVATFLSHWGVSVDPAQVDGPTFPDPLDCPFMRIDEVLNAFTTATNGDYLWEIDYHKHLRMFEAATTAAPFNIADGDRNTVNDVTVAPSLTTYATRVLVLAGAGLHDVTVRFVGDGTTASFPLQYWVAATRGYVTNNPAGHTGPDVNETLGDATAEWSYDNASASLTRNIGAPSAGSAITFIFTAQFPVLKYADPPGGVPDPPGIWELLVREPDVFDADVAQQHANAYVLAASQPTVTVKYRTLNAGAHPGQVQQIQRSARHLDAPCLITDVQISDQEGRTYRDVTALASATVAPINTWRDMIKGWNSTVSGGSASANIQGGTGGGSGGGGGGATITGRVGYHVIITGSNAGGESVMSETGGVVNMNGGSLTGANVVAATTLQGAYDASQLSGTLPDARLSNNVVLKNAPATALVGNITIGGTLGVSGATTLASLGVTSSATVGGTFSVTGTTTLGVLNAGASTLATLGVSGAATVGGALGVAGVVTAPAFHASPASAGAPGELYADANSGLTLYSTTGAADDFALLSPSGSVIARVPTGTTTLELAGGLNSIGYVSGLTGWRITAGGDADFRSFSADALHAQTFVIDQTRALAGGEIIAASAAMLAADVVMPNLGGSVTITVQDLTNAPGMPVFAVNDWVMLRTFTRSSGALTVADVYGQVTAPVTGLAGNTQSWTFTRGGGTMATSTVVPSGNVVIDFGVSGSGYYEVQGADGAYDANGPYAQIVTWATAPISSNRTLRTRFGNLFGVTNVANEYGLLAGTYAATNGRYFRASSTTFELHGIDLLLWDGGVNTVKLDHAAPYLAMGNPRPVTFSDGVAGVWFGKDGTTYKFRVGTPGGNGITYDGAGTLTVTGAINVTSGNAAKTDLSNVTGAYAGSSSGAGGPAKWVAPTVPVSAINGAGLYLGSNILGYYNGSSWLSYMTNAGAFYLGGGSAGHSLYWDGNTLTITGAITATTGTFTGTIHAASGTIGGFTIDSANISNANIDLNSTGLVECINGSSDAVGMTSFGIGGTSTIRFWVGNGGGTVRNLMITTDGSLYSNGTLSAVVFSAGSYYLAQQGPNVAGYAFNNNVSTYWGSDSTNRLAMVANNIRLFFDGTQFFPETSTGRNLGHPSFQWGTLFVVNVTQSSDRRVKTDIVPTRYGTAFVRALQPVDYFLKRTGDQGHGFIAQDVAALDPMFGGVSYHEGVATGLNYSAFIGPLVRAFQELDARVSALEGRSQHGE
jgi:hypothetical protein